MYGTIPFVIVYFIYLEIPRLGDEAHHMANYGLFWRYVDRFSFLVFASLLGASFLLLHSKIPYPRSFATFGRNNLIVYYFFLLSLHRNSTSGCGIRPSFH